MPERKEEQPEVTSAYELLPLIIAAEQDLRKLILQTEPWDESCRAHFATKCAEGLLMSITGKVYTDSAMQLIEILSLVDLHIALNMRTEALAALNSLARLMAEIEAEGE